MITRGKEEVSSQVERNRSRGFLPLRTDLLANDKEKALDSTASRAFLVVLSVYEPASSRAVCFLKVITEAQHGNVFVLARQIENVEFAVGIGSTDTHLSELAFVEIVP